MSVITRLETEKLLTAFALQGRDATAYISNTLGLDENNFEDSSLRVLYAACVSLYAKHKEVDSLSVQQFLREELHQAHFVEKDKIKEVERLSAVAKDIAHDYHFLIQQSAPQTAVQFLKTETQRRNLLMIVSKVHDKLIGGGALDDVANYGIAELMTFSHNYQNISSNAYRSLGQAIAEVEQEIKEESEGKINWFSTGIDSVDEMIHGLHMGRLYVIAAEAKVGKSLLANQIALNNAIQNIPAGIVSMEMPGREIAKRYSGISQHHDAAHKKKLLDSFKEKAKHLPLYFRQGGNTSKSLLISLQKLVIDKKCKLIVLDYLQLVQLEEKYKNRVDGIDSLMAQLKAFSEENQVVIIVVSAILTKQVARRTDGKPSCADIVGSGRIVNDCDVLLFLWLPKKENSKLIELFVEQGRNGESGKAQLYIDDKLRITQTEILKSEPSPLYNVDEKDPFTRRDW